MIAALFSGLSWRAFVAVLGGIAIIAVILVARSDIRKAAVVDINTANDKAMTAADRAELAYRACIASGKEPTECAK